MIRKQPVLLLTSVQRVTIDMSPFLEKHRWRPKIHLNLDNKYH